MSLSVAVISDVVCPWCYIGKRRLEAALPRLNELAGEAVPVSLRWLPFQLNPGLSQRGMPRADYLRQKFGERSADIYARVSGVGREVGIDFAFERIAVQPNTVQAHRLIAYAQRRGNADDVVEGLFRAYFLHGADLTQDTSLVDIAANAGCERSAAAAYLAGDEDRAHIEAADREHREIGIDGVPFYVLANKFGVSGAQDAEILAGAMLRAWREKVD